MLTEIRVKEVASGIEGAVQLPVQTDSHAFLSLGPRQSLGAESERSESMAFLMPVESFVLNHSQP